MPFFGMNQLGTQEPHSCRVMGQMTAERQGVAASSASLILLHSSFSVRHSLPMPILVLDFFTLGFRFVPRTL
jgi:hypothetical protein